MHLQHHGILGQKWGVRRFQNRDGSLTPAGLRRLQKQDDKWAKKNYEKIEKYARRPVQNQLNAYGRELMRDRNSYNANGKLSAAAINTYNRKAAELMNEAAKDIRSPSGKVIKFIAKRGELGVHMALATENYDISRLKNGVWGDGRIAYKSNSIEMR